MRITPVLIALVLGSLLAPLAGAEERLGEPWEQDIVDGIAAQEQEREREGRSAAGILRQAELLAARRSEGATRVVRLYLLARAYGLTGDTGSAAATYREVLQLAPRCYFAYHDLSMLQMSLEPPNRDHAERYLRQALRIHPRYVTAQRKLSRLLLDGGKVAEAVTQLEGVVEKEPTDLQARYLLAQGLLDLSRFDDAERQVVQLIRRDPKAPAFRELKGDLYLARGRYEDALKVYERLAREHPSAAQPLRRYLHVLDQLRTKQEVFDPERWLWGLEGLLRTVKDEKEREQLKTAIDELRRPVEERPVAVPEGPPSDEVIVAALQRAPAPDRVQILRYVYAREEAPGDELLQALIRRLSAKTEPSAEGRMWALRVLSRFGGYGLVGLLRHSLSDPEPTVRPVAADSLLALAETHPAARGAALLVLGLYADNVDRTLASAARAAVLELANASLEGEGEGSYGTSPGAFRVWWIGPAASEAKIEALESFAAVGDRFPEDVLVPYLQDRDAYVVNAAWRTTAAAFAKIADARTTSAERRRWFAALPPYREGALAGPTGPQERERLRTWVARKPRP